MKHRIVLLLFLAALFLAACGRQPESADGTGSPWPTHAPGATPYVRQQPVSSEALHPEDKQDPAGQYESYYDFIRSMYAQEGNFYGNDWELQMFKALPQDEPYSFVIHTAAMLHSADTDTADEHIALAQIFAGLGCEAKVKESRSIEDGKEYVSWITIVTTTPARLWELSDSMDEYLHVEQLYESVDAKYDTVIWPEE